MAAVKMTLDDLAQIISELADEADYAAKDLNDLAWARGFYQGKASAYRLAAKWIHEQLQDAS